MRLTMEAGESSRLRSSIARPSQWRRLSFPWPPARSQKEWYSTHLFSYILPKSTKAHNNGLRQLTSFLYGKFKEVTQTSDIGAVQCYTTDDRGRQWKVRLSGRGARQGKDPTGLGLVLLLGLEGAGRRNQTHCHAKGNLPPSLLLLFLLPGTRSQTIHFLLRENSSVVLLLLKQWKPPTTNKGLSSSIQKCRWLSKSLSKREKASHIASQAPHFPTCGS